MNTLEDKDHALDNVVLSHSLPFLFAENNYTTKFIADQGVCLRTDASLILPVILLANLTSQLDA